MRVFAEGRVGNGAKRKRRLKSYRAAVSRAKHTAWSALVASIAAVLLLIPVSDADAASCTRHIYNESSTPVTVTLIKAGEPLNPVQDWTGTIPARGHMTLSLHNDVRGFTFGRGTGQAVQSENQIWPFTGFGNDTDESVRFIEKYGSMVPGKVGKAIKAGLKFNIFWNAYKYAVDKPDCYWVHGGRSHSFAYGVVFNDPADGDIKITDKSELITHNPGSVRLKGIAHVEGKGDVSFTNTTYAGTGGQALRMEGFQLQIAPPVSGLNLQYKAHLAHHGDTPWQRGGSFLGTRGQSRSIEGIEIDLVGPAASQYDVFYVCHLQDIGDTPTKRNGEYCGTRGQSLRLEGLAVWIAQRPDIAALDRVKRQRDAVEQTNYRNPVVIQSGGQNPAIQPGVQDPAAVQWRSGDQVDVLRPADNRWTAATVMGVDPIDGVLVQYHDTYQQMWTSPSSVRAGQGNQYQPEGAPYYDQGQYHQDPYGQSQYDQGGYAPDPYDQGQYSQGPYGQGQHDQGGYDPGPYDQGQYGQPYYDQGQYEQGGYAPGAHQGQGQY